MYNPATGSMESQVSGMSAGNLSADMQLQQQQQQNGFIQFPGGVTAVNQQGIPTGYWTTGGGPNDPTNQMQNGGMPMQMFMNGQQAAAMGMPGMALGGMDTNRRMVFNPATGQYNSVPVTGSMMGGGVQQNQAGGNRGGPNLNGPGANGGGAYGLNQSMMGGSGNSLNIPMLLPRNQNQLGGAVGGGVGGMPDMDGSMFMHLNHHGNNLNRDDNDRGGNNYMDNYGRDNRDRRNDRDNYRDNGRGNDRDNRNGGRDRDNNRDNRDRNGRNNSQSNNNNSGVNPVRDSLVEDFRSTYGKSKQWGLRDLLGHVVAFCQDQHGSRFIQQRLEVCSDVDKQLIFDEIIPAAQSLMTDVFGNYVLQKLFEYGTPDQCESLALLLKGQSVQLAMQMYGCRVVQKALEYVNTPRLIELVAEFESPPVRTITIAWHVYLP
jgi:hypothetical protein